MITQFNLCVCVCVCVWGGFTHYHLQVRCNANSEIPRWWIALQKVMNPPKGCNTVVILSTQRIYHGEHNFVVSVSILAGYGIYCHNGRHTRTSVIDSNGGGGLYLLMT